MNDIRHYSDQELSLLIFNDEYFYIERRNRPYLMALIKEEFIYTRQQMKELINDLQEDEDEEILHELRS
tara:strand:- start:523 stop:729 length:207 start_codon:yes stop_codon:yes gene_type:complete